MFFKIRPAFIRPNVPTFETHLSSMEVLINSILPNDHRSKESLEEFFEDLNARLPIIQWSKDTKPPSVISIALLCTSHNRFTNGTGRFFSDMIDRFALPGHYLGLEYIRSFDFFFIDNEKKQYFICEIGLRVNTEEELRLIEKNLPNLSQEIRLIIEAVFEARQIISLKPLTIEEKSALIQDKITSLIERPSKEFDLNVFDQMQHLFHKLSAEEKNTQINELISPFVERRPQTFDRDIFNEIQYFVLLFRDQFTAIRDLKHISRIICFQYLFRKSSQTYLKVQPEKRQIFVKFLKSTVRLGPEPVQVLGIVIGIHFINSHELIGSRHITETFLSIAPDAIEVENSFIIDNRTEKIRLLYIEFRKKNETFFSRAEIHALRKYFASELNERIENVAHTLFMSRNDEEILRHIVNLNNELKYVNDLPQVVVTFEKQAAFELSFNVILLRLLKSNTKPLKEIFSTLDHNISFEEVKIVGCLKNKFPKEANVFKITLHKAPYFRKDYSLDLNKARQSVISALTSSLGDVRDYNGGMIATKGKVFKEFKELLQGSEPLSDFLMENFFYSIEPPLMQTLIDPDLLKAAFLMLIEALDHDFKNKGPFFRTKVICPSVAAMLASTVPFYKEDIFKILESSQISLSELTYSLVNVREIFCLALFFHSNDEEKKERFCKAVEDNFKLFLAQAK